MGPMNFYFMSTFLMLCIHERETPTLVDDGELAESLYISAHAQRYVTCVKKNYDDFFFRAVCSWNNYKNHGKKAQGHSIQQ